MTADNDLVAYYSKRAPILEEVYEKRACQADLAKLRDAVCAALKDHDVLEVACGTGYWTASIAACAASVLGTDASADMLRLAQAKGLPADKVGFALADAFRLDVPGTFDACFAGFWWSHVRRDEQAGFLAEVRRHVGKDGLLVMIDNCHIEGDTPPIARTDADGNTYQIRTLPDGSRHDVLKNYPTDSALRKRLGVVAKDIRILRLTHYWILSCRFK